MKKKVIIFLASLIANMAFANSNQIAILDEKYSVISDFKKYSTGNNGLVWYYSPSSVKRYVDDLYPNKELWNVIIKLKHKDGYLIEHEQIDCKANFVTFLSRLYYKKDGSPEVISKQRLIFAGSSGSYIRTQGLIDLKNIVCL
jgi:hypothetical protein